MNQRVLGITTGIADISHHIADMGKVCLLTVTETVQHQGQVHVCRACHRVGTIADKVLVEPVIALTGQQLCDTLALSIQILYIKNHPALQASVLWTVQLQQVVDGCVLDVIVYMTDIERLTGKQQVGCIYPTPLHRGQHINVGPQKTLVLQLLLDSSHRQACLQRVIQHRRFSDSPQRTVQPARGITPG